MAIVFPAVITAKSAQIYKVVWNAKLVMSSIIQHVIRNNVHLAHSWHQIILVFLAAITVTVVQVMMNAWNVEVDMNLMVQNV